MPSVVSSQRRFLLCCLATQSGYTFFHLSWQKDVLKKATANLADLGLKYSHQIYKTKQNKENRREQGHYLENLEVVTSFTEKQKETLVKSSRGSGNRKETWKCHTVRETRDWKELRKLVLEAGVGEMRKHEGIAMGAGKHLEGIRRKLTIVFA